MTAETGEPGPDGRVQFLLTPPRTAGVTEACLERIADGLPRDSRVLAVTTSCRGESFVEDWIKHFDCRPCDVVVFELGESSRSASTRRDDETDAGVGSVTVAGDHADVLRTVERLGNEWETDGNRPVVYLDSASELLYSVGLPRAVEWIRSLTDAAAANGWRCVLQADRERHDLRTLLGLSLIADSVHGLAVEDETWSWYAVDDLTEAMPPPTGDLRLDDVFDALRSPRRRLVLQSLGQANRTLPVSELAASIAARESSATESTTQRERERIYTSLSQIHLPKLDDLGLIQLDEATDAIELTNLARRAEPYLLLALSEGP